MKKSINDLVNLIYWDNKHKIYNFYRNTTRNWTFEGFTWLFMAIVTIATGLIAFGQCLYTVIHNF